MKARDLPARIVRLGYFEKHGKPMSDADLEAFRRFSEMYDIDADSYQEWHEKCRASMRLESEDMYRRMARRGGW